MSATQLGNVHQTLQFMSFREELTILLTAVWLIYSLNCHQFPWPKCYFFVTTCSHLFNYEFLSCVPGDSGEA